MVFTFLLCLVILTVVMAKALQGNQIYGPAIGITLATIGAAGGPLSGGAFNPAIGINPWLYRGFFGDSPNGRVMILNLVGPLLGGALASYFDSFANLRGEG